MRRPSHRLLTGIGLSSPRCSAKTGFIQGQPTYTYSYAAALSVAATPASLSSAVSQRRCVPGHPSKYATPGLTLAEEARAVTRTMARARLSEH